MRKEIKALAEELLIQNGYRGMSFGDIASQLDMTRANIHYHFGNKHSLVEEIIEDYVTETLASLKKIWEEPDMSLVDRIDAMIEHSRRRYDRFNQQGNKSQPWSLIARMRQDSKFLTSKGRAELSRFGDELASFIFTAVEAAKAKGEFCEALPAEDVTVQLVSVANSAAPITQDAAGFERLERLYGSIAQIITIGFGPADTFLPSKAHSNKALKNAAASKLSARKKSTLS